MVNLLQRMRPPWPRFTSVPAAAVPFAVSCACGQVVTGRRRRDFQAVVCPQCGAAVFVLPLSPFPPAATTDGPASASLAPRRGGRPWLVGAAIAALLGLALIAAIWVQWFAPPSGSASDPDEIQLTARNAAHSLLQKADDHVRHGHFALALEELDALDRMVRQHSDVGVDLGWLDRQRREIRLHADLLDVPLEELLTEAVDLPEGEWQSRFSQRYAGKGVIFDAVINRLEDGGFDVDYRIESGAQSARLDLGRPPALRSLPVRQPRRVFFGARLRAINLERPGHWSIQCAPDDVVLLTDQKALAIACPDLGSPAVREILARQAVWASR